MSETKAWVIVKTANGTCEIMPSTEAEGLKVQEKWGPFASQGEAIARRVGLIRAGKCQPV